MIEGGYYIKARCIQESEVMKMPPHTREIWDWILMNASHADLTYVKRGQLLCTYDDIREALSWKVGWRKMTYSKWDCEKAMKLLKKAEMVATRKTTRGMIITVLQYDKYQNPANYESHNASHRKATGKPQTADTIDKNVKNKELRITTVPTKSDSTNNNTAIKTLEDLKDQTTKLQLARLYSRKYGLEPGVIVLEIDRFIRWWEEPDDTQKNKSRWEARKSFNAHNRLLNWIERIKARMITNEPIIPIKYERKL